MEVERELGFNNKRQIEEFGIDRFVELCKARVDRFAGIMTEQSKRLGMWMDWGNDYFTFADTNIEYIWKFLRLVHERGWLYMGHRSTEWCPRCGTSLSPHELTQSGVYQDRADPSLFVRLPLLDREGQSVVVWTTTPWTLPANVAAAHESAGRTPIRGLPVAVHERDSGEGDREPAERLDADCLAEQRNG